MDRLIASDAGMNLATDEYFVTTVWEKPDRTRYVRRLRVPGRQAAMGPSRILQDASRAIAEVMGGGHPTLGGLSDEYITQMLGPVCQEP